MTRLEQLKRLAEAQPDDPMLHYGVALEYVQRREWEPALAAFDRALGLDGRFTAAYYHKARAELSAGRRAAAGKTLAAGIEVARAAGEAHLEQKMAELLEVIS